MSPSLCNASITWASSNSNVATASGSGTSATVTKAGNGAITLTATLNNGCSNGNIVVAKSISIGSPVETISYATNGPCNNGTQTWSLNASAGNNITSWQWTKDPSATGSWYIYNPSSPSTLVDVYGGGIRLTTTNNCGSTLDGVSIYSNCPRIAAITASPNPAIDNVNITIAEPKEIGLSDQKKTMIYQIKVEDQFGNLKKQYKYSSGISNASISLRGLMKGMYTIQAFDGTTWSSVQVIKQ